MQDRSTVNKNSAVRVHPTQVLGRRISLKQIQKAVDHDKIVKFEMFHEKQHKASLDAIRAREKIADARVRARLIERRKKKSLQTQARKATLDTNVTASSSQPSPVELVEVESIRLAIQGKVKTMKKLNRLFAKLDVDRNGMMM